MRRLLAAAGSVALALPASAVAPGTLREFPFPTAAHVYPFGLAPGADGNLWFADQGCTGSGACGIGRRSLTNGHTALLRRGLAAGSIPYSVAPGADGDVWFTDEGRRPAIGRVSPTGAIVEFQRGLLDGSLPFEITLGPGGDMWFTDQGRRPAIGRITAAGRITEFTHGLPRGAMPFGIAAGAGGTIWFTDHGCGGSGRCAIGRVSRRGVITETRVGLRQGAVPLGMAAGFGPPAPAVWFADASGALGRISASGTVSELTAGLPAGSSPVAIAAGPDGAMWFTDDGGSPAVGRVTAAGLITEYSSGLAPGDAPAVIAPAANGAMWFSDESGTGALWRVATGVPSAVGLRPAVVRGSLRGSRLSCTAPDWPAWAGVRPSPREFHFDGYRWMRGGRLIRGARSAVYRPTAADTGHRLSCEVTATYRPPWLVSVTGVSRAVPATAP